MVCPRAQQDKHRDGNMSRAKRGIYAIQTRKRTTCFSRRLGNGTTEDVDAPLQRAGFELAGGGPTEPAHDPRQRIDHVAVAGLAIGPVTIGDAPVSDHRPLIVELN